MSFKYGPLSNFEERIFMRVNLILYTSIQLAAPRRGRGCVPGVGVPDADDRAPPHLRHLRPDVHHRRQELLPLPLRLHEPPRRLRPQLLRPLPELPKVITLAKEEGLPILALKFDVKLHGEGFVNCLELRQSKRGITQPTHLSSTIRKSMNRNCFCSFNVLPTAAIVKTLVMMAGEIEYENFIYENGEALFGVTGHVMIMGSYGVYCFDSLNL